MPVTPLTSAHDSIVRETVKQLVASGHLTAFTGPNTGVVVSNRTPLKDLRMENLSIGVWSSADDSKKMVSIGLIGHDGVEVPFGTSTTELHKCPFLNPKWPHNYAEGGDPKKGVVPDMADASIKATVSGLHQDELAFCVQANALICVADLIVGRSGKMTKRIRDHVKGDKKTFNTTSLTVKQLVSFMQTIIEEDRECTDVSERDDLPMNPLLGRARDMDSEDKDAVIPAIKAAASAFITMSTKQMGMYGDDLERRFPGIPESVVAYLTSEEVVKKAKGELMCNWKCRINFFVQRLSEDGQSVVWAHTTDPDECVFNRGYDTRLIVGMPRGYNDPKYWGSRMELCGVEVYVDPTKAVADAEHEAAKPSGATPAIGMSVEAFKLAQQQGRGVKRARPVDKTSPDDIAHRDSNYMNDLNDEAMEQMAESF